MVRILSPLAFLVALGGSLHAREGGILVNPCPPLRDCTGDSLEIVFANGRSTYDGPIDVGTEIPTEIVLETESQDIQGYSYAVRHEPERLDLLPDSVTTAGTIIDPSVPGTVMCPPNFHVTQAVPGGFMSAVVFSFLGDRVLPVRERPVVARARYILVSHPGCTLIEFVDGELAVPRSPPVAINITVGGLAKAPQLVHGLIEFGSCPELCGDSLDNDGDGAIDCDDEECARRGVCARPEDCGDGVDNDLDGHVDCGDPDCFSALECRETCDDGVDNNGDGLIDCDDPRCRSVSACGETCDDGIDNNGDGLADCSDPQCWSQPPCGETCDDGVDNNGDGLADCDDPQCRGHVACRMPEVCNDGVDNDGDGFVDCRDRDCREFGFCGFVPGADGGVLERFCDGVPDWDCTEDTLEVIFADDSSTLRGETPPGSEIAIAVVMETLSGRVEGWSYGVRHDPEVLSLVPESVTTSGTVGDFAPAGVAIPPQLDVTRAVAGGFVSAVLLGLEVETQLPLKRNRIVRATYVVRSDPAGTRIELVDPERLPQAAGLPPGIRIIVDGESKRPLRLRHGWIAGTLDTPQEICGDGMDNDDDGLTDCRDRDCEDASLCCESCAGDPGFPGLAIPVFTRGDADGDGRATVGDAVVIILVSIGSRSPRYDCADALDADDDDRVTIGDSLPILNWVFRRGGDLPGPFPACGHDRNSLTCRESSPACR